jgi:flagellar hook-length control protein FliK
LQATPQQLANAAQLGNNLTASPRPGVETVRLDTPMKDQAWPAEFGQKVVWLATQDKQSAQITLNPPDLGPIELSLKVKNDQATVAFTSANSGVREAIELALPRLREMLAGVGIELGQTNVSAESFRQQADNNNGNHGNRSNRTDAGETNAPLSGQLRVETMPGRNIQRGNGLVDTFA